MSILAGMIRKGPRKPMLDPDRDHTLDRVYVVYRWAPRKEVWLLDGFIRGHVSVKRLRVYRRRHDLSPSSVIKLVELELAAKHGPPTMPHRTQYRIVPTSTVRHYIPAPIGAHRANRGER